MKEHAEGKRDGRDRVGAKERRGTAALALAVALALFGAAPASGQTPVAQFDSVASSVDEGTATATVTVNLSPAPTGNITLNFTLGAAGTATQDVSMTSTPTTGADFAVSLTAAVTSGAASADITVTITDDDRDEPNETVILMLAAGGADYTVGTMDTHTLTITDDDVPEASFDAATSSHGESDGTAMVTVSFDPVPHEDITLAYTLSGDATRNTDYTAAGTVTVSAEASTVDIAVVVTTDDDDEPDETVILTLASGGGYAVGTMDAHTLTITDDDVPEASFDAATSSHGESDGTAMVTVSFDPAPHEDITLAYTLGGDATRNTDYTAADTVTVSAEASTVDIAVAVTLDDAMEMDETVILTLVDGTGYTAGTASTHTLTIEDDDSLAASFAAATSAHGENAGAVNVMVSLSAAAPPGGTVVNYTVGGSATAPGDHDASSGTVTVAEGATQAPIVVTIADDSSPEGVETVVLTLTGGSGYIVRAARSTHTLTIRDDDAIVASFMSAASSSAENVASASVTVSFMPAVPPGGLTLRYSVGGTATERDDFSALAGTVMAAANASSVTIVVGILDDDADEPDETVILSLEDGSGYRVGTPSVHTLTITDNDVPEASFADSMSMQGEGDGTATVTVELAPPPHENVMLTYTFGGTAIRNTSNTATPTPNSDFTAAGTVLVSANQSMVDIEVDITDDEAVENDETVILTLTGGTGYTVDATSSTHTLTIEDNDLPEASFATRTSRFSENAGTVNVVVNVAPPPLGSITLTYSVTGTAGAGDYSALTGSATVADGISSVNIAVTITDDGDDESHETVVLTLTGAGSAYKLGTRQVHTLTIRDNDTDSCALGEDATQGNLLPAADAQGAGLATLDDGEVLLEVHAPECEDDVQSYEFRFGAFSQYPSGFSEQRPIWGELNCTDGTAVIASTSEMACGYTLTGLPYRDRGYRLEVRAVYPTGESAAVVPEYHDADGDGGVSVLPKTSAPEPPSGFSATAGDETLFLAWMPPADDGGARIVRYDYYYDKDAATSCAAISQSDAGWADARVNLAPLAPDYRAVAAGLDNNADYRLCVRAVNQAGKISGAAYARGTPLGVPRAPSRLLVAVRDRGVRLTWACVAANPDADGATFTEDYEYRWTSRAQSSVVWRRAGGTCSADGEMVEDITGLANGTEYRFEVRARNDSGPGTPIVVAATPGPAPSEPTNLQAGQAGGTVTLTWDAPADGGRAIVRYECQYRCEGPVLSRSQCPAVAGTWTSCPRQPALQTSAAIPNLNAGQRYGFRVRACNLSAAVCPEDIDAGGDGTSAWAVADALIGVVPAAPVLTVDVDDREVTVAWDAVDSLGGAVLSYEYRFGADPTDLGTWRVVSGGGSARSLVASGLANGTEYTFEVRATNAFGTGAAGTATATPVAGEARVTLTATGGEREVVLTWAPATDPASILSYDYRWGRPGSLGQWQSAALLTTVTVSDLEAGVDYVFEVRARTAAGPGEVSRAAARALEPGASGLPGRPVGLTVATARDRQVELRWQAPPPGAFPLSGYEYRWGVAGEGGTTFGQWQSLAPVLGISVSVPANGVAYSFEVRAVNQSGAGPAATVSATAAGGTSAPLSLVAAAGDGEVRLTWQAPADGGGGGLVTYAYRYRAAGVRFGDWIDAGTESSVVVAGLANGITYGFEVRAQTEAGSGLAATAVATPADAPAVPSVPRGFAAETLANGAVGLAWRAPSSDGGLPIVRYELRWRVGEGDFGAWSGAGGVTTERSLDGLVLGQPHTFEVRAVNAVGAGDAASATVRPATPPAVPGRLAAEAAQGAVALSWIAPEDDGGSAVVRYEYRFAASAAPFGRWRDAGAALAVTVSALDNGVEHAFEVRAVNDLGAGAAARVTATPAARPGTVALSGFGRDAAVLLRWQAPQDDGGSAVVRYEVRHRTTGGEFVEWAVAGLDLERSIGGLSNDVEHVFEVRAVNGAGAGAAATVRATPRADSVPVAPALSALAEARSVRLVWEAPADDGGAPIRRYEYRWQPAGDAFGQWFSVGLDASVTVEELINGIEYVFEVRAVNDLGAGEADSASATPADVPSAPSLALLVGAGEVDLSWGAPSDDGGLAVLRYEYRWGQEGADAGAWTDAGLDTAATVRELVNGRTYAFAVRAVNERGAGEEGTATATPTPGVEEDVLLRAWLARFGRVAGGHVVGAVDARMHLAEDAGGAAAPEGDVRRPRAPPRRTSPESRQREGGRVRHRGGTGGRVATIGWGSFQPSAVAWAAASAGALPDRIMSLSAAAAGGGSWTAWGRLAASRFAGEQPRLAIDGTVVTVTGGADYSQGALLAGIALSHSLGRGDFGLLATEEYPARAGDEVESTLTGAYPYVRVERGPFTGWGMFGRGAGSVTLFGAGGERSHDIGGSLGAFGARGTLASIGGLQLAVKSDAFLASLDTDTEVTSATANRFRLLVEASRALRTDAGAVVSAVSELGWRLDGGAAEKGGGMEFGAGFDYGGRRVDLAARARGLVLHGESALREWGGVVSVAVKARPSGRGLSLRLSPGWGVAASGAERLWADGVDGRRGDAGRRDVGPHLAAELAFAADVLRGRALATPYVGLDASRAGERWRVGWRIAGRTLRVEVEARRRATAGDLRDAFLVRLSLQPWSGRESWR